MEQRPTRESIEFGRRIVFMARSLIYWYTVGLNFNLFVNFERMIWIRICRIQEHLACSRFSAVKDERKQKRARETNKGGLRRGSPPYSSLIFSLACPLFSLIPNHREPGTDLKITQIIVHKKSYVTVSCAS